MHVQLAHLSYYARDTTYTEQVGRGFRTHHFLPHVDSPVLEEERAVGEEVHGVLSVLPQGREDMESRSLVGALVLFRQPCRWLVLSQQLLVRASGTSKLRAWMQDLKSLEYCA